MQDSTYNLSYALTHPASEQYHRLIGDLDAIALQLRKLSDAGVPVLWRPLHEADMHHDLDLYTAHSRLLRHR